MRAYRQTLIFGCTIFSIFCIFLFALCWQANGAGTVTLTQSRGQQPVRRLVFDWVSDAAGVVSGTVSGTVNGKIVGVITDPGTPAPTDNYDVTMINSDGFDVFNGRGIDRDTVNTEQFCPAVAFTDGVTAGVTHVAVAGTLELRIANAGNAKAGRVIVLLE